MDYKDKYNKLVNAIKVLQETNQSDEGIQNWVNDNVPELKENEYESTRKRIIALVNAHGQGGFKESMLAWLEKQGQKSVEWHREDEQNLNACLGYIPDEFLRRWLTDIIHIKYDKSTWSKEDEEIVTGIIKDIQERLEDYPIEQLADIYFKEIKWLKFIKQRISLNKEQEDKL